MKNKQAIKIISVYDRCLKLVKGEKCEFSFGDGIQEEWIRGMKSNLWMDDKIKIEVEVNKKEGGLVKEITITRVG